MSNTHLYILNDIVSNLEDYILGDKNHLMNRRCGKTPIRGFK